MTQDSSKPVRKRSHKNPGKTNLVFSDGTTIAMPRKHTANYRKKEMGIHKIPEEKQATELPREESLDTDQYDTMEYPPPSRDKAFRKIWADGIGNITARENFDVSHLSLFETYCSLLVSLRVLDDFILKNGQTYRVTTLTGESRRTHPEVLERTKTINQIAQYAKLLDLLPKKDKSTKVKKQDTADWT